MIGAGYQSPPQPSLFLARIVRWIDVDDTKRPRTSNLHDGIAGHPSIIVRLAQVLRLATRTQQHAFVGVELVAHADMKLTRQYSDILILWMIMGRDFVARRHFQPNNE